MGRLEGDLGGRFGRTRVSVDREGDVKCLEAGHGLFWSTSFRCLSVFQQMFDGLLFLHSCLNIPPYSFPPCPHSHVLSSLSQFSVHLEGSYRFFKSQFK
jgi:hypothetical protein